MIFLPEPRYFSLGAGRSRNGLSVEDPAAPAARDQSHVTMSPRVLVVLVALAFVGQAASRPVRRTLNFNMFLLRPRQDAPDRFLLTTDGVSRFGPILEYLVQRVQGLMSVKRPVEESLHADEAAAPVVPIADAAENEIDGVQKARMPGVVVRPSRTKPGTYEVEIDVVVDDGQPDEGKAYNNRNSNN